MTLAHALAYNPPLPNPRLKPGLALLLTFLLIEFLDELVFGVREAAWPLIRDDLGLSYIQIGLLLSLPDLFASLVEPFFGILADQGRRRLLILGGGLAFTLALAWVSTTGSFLPLLVSFLLLYPASGAFVSLSQSALMDSAPERHDHNMARWTFAGSLGVVAGPLLLSLFLLLELGWRPLFAILAGLSLFGVLAAARLSFLRTSDHRNSRAAIDLWQGLKTALRSLRNREVLRWLTLLEFSDLMLDVLYGFLALYFVDVVGRTPQEAALGVTVWAGVGLLGDFLLIPLLEKVDGLRYLRWSVRIELVLFPLFLLLEPFGWKLLVLGVIGLFNSGWYAILKGRLYTAMPGQSGTVLAVDNLFGMFASFIPLLLGLVAERWGLDVTMWMLLAGPLALTIGLPSTRKPALGE